MYFEEKKYQKFEHRMLISCLISICRFFFPFTSEQRETKKLYYIHYFFFVTICGVEVSNF